MGTGICNWIICIVEPTKMSGLTLFHIATWINSRNSIWKWDSEWTL